MKVIIKKPNQAAELGNIPNTLASLQKQVGGYIETVKVAEDVIAIVDEEGRMKGKEPNALGLVGTIVFCGIKDDEFADIPQSNIDWLVNKIEMTRR